MGKYLLEKKNTIGMTFAGMDSVNIWHHPKPFGVIMLSLLFFVACFETSNPTEPSEPISPIYPDDPVEEGSCLEEVSSLGWDEDSPESISMKEFMEAIPESFTSTVVLNEQYDYPVCVEISLIPDTESLRYTTSEYAPPSGDISNGMMPLCLNRFTVDAQISLTTAQGELSENVGVELKLQFEEDGSYFMFLNADLDDVQGAVGNILDGQDIEGIYLDGFITENNFDGGIYATTIEEDGEIVIATRYALAQWSGEPQEQCE